MLALCAATPSMGRLPSPRLTTFSTLFWTASGQESPFFYIKYGPPASGKGSIMSRVLEKDGLNEESLVTVDVDAIIQNNADYASERRRIEKVKDDVKRKKMLQNLYFQFRKQADVISDNVLDAALLKDLDIAWETTGAKVAWTIKEINRIKRHGYVIKIIYPPSQRHYSYIGLFSARSRPAKHPRCQGRFAKCLPWQWKTSYK